MNLILGGSARFGLDVPHTRLFKPPSDQVGRKRSGGAGVDGRRRLLLGLLRVRTRTSPKSAISAPTKANTRRRRRRAGSRR